MGNAIENIKAPMKITTGSNIDPRYFAYNDDGTYTVTPTFIYNLVRDATKYYKEQIFSLDTDCEYHTEKLSLTEDTWADKKKKDELEAKYGEQIKELEKRKRDWREANSDKCSTRAGGPDLGDIDEMRYFASYSPENKPTLSQALALYKWLKEFDKENGATLKESLPQKPEVLLVMKEFRPEYDALIEKWVDELGIDHDLYFKSIDKIERVVSTMRRTNEKVMKAVSSNDDGLEEYAQGLIRYLTSTNKVDFKAQRAECITLIDKDFVMTFNDTAKELKAESTSHDESSDGIDSIVIWTKTTEAESPIKLITISRENPTDNYKYVISIDVDGNSLRFSKEIATKADLRKALNMTVDMIEDVSPFDRYVPDIQNTIDTL